jgi:hypothetical protein
LQFVLFFISLLALSGNQNKCSFSKGQVARICDAKMEAAGAAATVSGGDRLHLESDLGLASSSDGLVDKNLAFIIGSAKVPSYDNRFSYMQSRLPNYVHIIKKNPLLIHMTRVWGVQCATTSLWYYLSQHPEVFGHPLKETKFFYRGENDGLSGEQIHRAYLDIYQQTNDPKLTTVRAASSSHIAFVLRAACCVLCVVCCVSLCTPSLSGQDAAGGHARQLL